MVVNFCVSEICEGPSRVATMPEPWGRCMDGSPRGCARLAARSGKPDQRSQGAAAVAERAFNGIPAIPRARRGRASRTERVARTVPRAQHGDS